MLCLILLDNQKLDQMISIILYKCSHKVFSYIHFIIYIIIIFYYNMYLYICEERERDLFIYRIFASVTYIASGYIEKELRAHFRIKLMDRERFRIKEGFRGIKVLLYYHFADNYIVGMNGKRCRCNNAILRFFLPGKNISSGRNLSLSLSAWDILKGSKGCFPNNRRGRWQN